MVVVVVGHLRQETCGRKSHLHIEIGVDIAARDVFNLLRLDFCDQCFIHTFRLIFTNVCWLTFCVEVLKVLLSIDSQGLFEVDASDCRHCNDAPRSGAFPVSQAARILPAVTVPLCLQRYLIHETLEVTPKQYQRQFRYEADLSNHTFPISNCHTEPLPAEIYECL